MGRGLIGVPRTQRKSDCRGLRLEVGILGVDVCPETGSRISPMGLIRCPNRTGDPSGTWPETFVSLPVPLDGLRTRTFHQLCLELPLTRVSLSFFTESHFILTVFGYMVVG